MNIIFFLSAVALFYDIIIVIMMDDDVVSIGMQYTYAYICIYCMKTDSVVLYCH